MISAKDLWLLLVCIAFGGMVIGALSIYGSMRIIVRLWDGSGSRPFWRFVAVPVLIILWSLNLMALTISGVALLIITGILP